ncbi:hypothetical protein [Phytopseudomonas dryadis]|uniref:Uncharacterized protein n=1 Tax=Phytopseudomonas dryadis TaxID=2487520 RepID=A0ABY1Z5X3_9GAMM|nr:MULTISPECIES: hypothetical protein [Pseudomonas]TBV01900.1 hypothetical protein DNK34_19985 [Pseudomonas dryadis]TBV12569.1 hypothetical protein DNK41_24425 [Pseudomonas sp. FRB 230]
MTALLANLELLSDFPSLEEAELQGIYLSSRHDGVPGNTEETAPDFTRLIDTAPDFQHRGLLDTISVEDLRDTDIYVFRESNGQLVAERRGLHEDELYQSYSGVDEQSGSFRFTIQLRGSAENTFATAGRGGEANFGKWQSAGGFQEAFQKRTANHLKAGETVRLIAINRATGYMGSTRIQLQAAVATGNQLNFAEQRIELAPPNLKVWAERRNQVEYGSTRGEQKRSRKRVVRTGIFDSLRVMRILQMQLKPCRRDRAIILPSGGMEHGIEW